MQNAEQTLRTALARHQAGDLAGAEQPYGQILARDPENAPATQFLGMLAHQTGSHERAVGLLRRSVELGRDVAEFHSNLAAARDRPKPVQLGPATR